jgi:hypothetical protein
MSPSYGTIVHHLDRWSARGHLSTRHAYRANGGVTQTLCGVGGQGAQGTPDEVGRWTDRTPGLTPEARATVDCVQCRHALDALLRRRGERGERGERGSAA